jgi:hypothetical protein
MTKWAKISDAGPNGRLELGSEKENFGYNGRTK